jgi:hypothetical protein
LVIGSNDPANNAMRDVGAGMWLGLGVLAVAV